MSYSITTNTRIIHLSDLHFGLRTVPTSDITSNIMELLSKLPNKDTIDYIAVTGDVFEDAIQYKRDEARSITRFINQLLRFCYIHNIVLIVLEGTDTHDHKQSRMFVTLNNERDKPIQLYYLETLQFLKIGELTFISIPDSIGSTQIIKHEVAKLLVENNCKKVNILLTHGMYTHHLDPKLHERYLDTLHNTEFYANVADLVLNGHIHPSSLVKNILTAGSFDRLRHGEEHPKGMWDISYDALTGEFTPTFVENKKAHLFITKQWLDEEVADVLTKAEILLNENVRLQTQHLRIIHHPTLNSRSITEWLKDKYPLLSIKCEAVKDKQVANVSVKVEDFLQIKKVSINKDTIVELLKQKMDTLNIPLLQQEKTLAVFEAYRG